MFQVVLCLLSLLFSWPPVVDPKFPFYIFWWHLGVQVYRCFLNLLFTVGRTQDINCLLAAFYAHTEGQHCSLTVHSPAEGRNAHHTWIPVPCKCSICALIVWMLLMIFFWWPTSVIPKLITSLKKTNALFIRYLAKNVFGAKLSSTL